MFYATTVRLVHADDPERGIPGVRVCLFDKDAFTRDDLLGEGTTDGQGEVRFEYNSEDFVDLDDRLGGVFPDLYVVVRDAEDREVVTTRAETVRNTPRKQITVPVDRALLEKHGLSG